MLKTLLSAPAVALLASACAVVPSHYGDGVVVAPALPLVVELGVDPFYFQGGFHYQFNNNRWLYSRSRSGPWVDLPHSHYPREIRRRDERGDRDGVNRRPAPPERDRP
jgi:hypothetical protein